MIQPRELRIGNIVHATMAGNVGGIVKKVIENGSDIDNARWWFGIPITEEWLLKLGFKKDRKGIKLKNFGVFVFNSMGTSFYPAGDVKPLLKMDNIKHVHQLQNLYYALWHEELGLMDF
jgi:hypothetical protein